ncbi:hypothetical protein [Chryseobacterium sp. RR2-3-20]|uniref:hypothetical protein n=1 Tax=Chryseobacterium sp. RR2-3-20 TaxID=2787626 RepID=UPI001AE02B88|nr:hypothetical protein [Chryseobacterium sp. RR2-3-20]
MHKSTDGQMTKQANASAKSKELHPNAQSQCFAAHLLLPQPHQYTSTDTNTGNRNVAIKSITTFVI